MSIYAIPIVSAQFVCVETNGSNDEVPPTGPGVGSARGALGALLERSLRNASAPNDALVLRATGGAANAGGRFVAGAIWSPIAAPE